MADLISALTFDPEWNRRISVGINNCSEAGTLNRKASLCHNWWRLSIFLFNLNFLFWWTEFFNCFQNPFVFFQNFDLSFGLTRESNFAQCRMFYGDCFLICHDRGVFFVCVLCFIIRPCFWNVISFLKIFFKFQLIECLKSYCLQNL